MTNDHTLRIADRIAALLAKAESSTFDEERDAFMAKAAELMERHRINELMLGLSRSRKATEQDPITKLEIIYDHTAFHIAFRDFMAAIGQAFGFKVVWRKDGKAGWWYGFKSDLDMAETVYASLLIQVARAAEVYKQTAEYKVLPKRMDKHVAKRSFISGFGSGAARKITEGRQVGQRDAEEEHGSVNVLPVLASRSEDLEVWFNSHVLGTLGKSSARARRGDRGASGAGYNAGRNADVGHSQVGGRRAIGR